MVCNGSWPSTNVLHFLSSQGCGSSNWTVNDVVQRRTSNGMEATSYSQCSGWCPWVKWNPVASINNIHRLGYLRLGAGWAKYTWKGMVEQRCKMARNMPSFKHIRWRQVSSYTVCFGWNLFKLVRTWLLFCLENRFEVNLKMPCNFFKLVTLSTFQKPSNFSFY